MTRDAGVDPPDTCKWSGHRAPGSSSFRMVSWMEWKSKWVVMMSELASSAGCCTGQKSCDLHDPGAPRPYRPGCWPVVRLTPVQPSVRRSASARLSTRPLFLLRTLRTKPIRGFVRHGGDGAGLEHVVRCRIAARYTCGPIAWYSPEKFRSISGALSPSKPKKGFKGDVVAVPVQIGAAARAVFWAA